MRLSILLLVQDTIKCEQAKDFIIHLWKLTLGKIFEKVIIGMSFQRGDSKEFSFL